LLPRDYALVIGGRVLAVNSIILSEVSPTVAAQLNGRFGPMTFRVGADVSDGVGRRFASFLNGATVRMTRTEGTGELLAALGLTVRRLVSPGPEDPDEVILRLNPVSLVAALDRFPTLRVVTGSGEYRVPTATALISPVLARALESGRFDYDFADEGQEFRIVADYLKGGRVKFDRSTIETVHRMAVDLQLGQLRDAAAGFIGQV
jgi:hypothetical protein